MKERLLENTRRYRKTKKGVVTNMYHKMKVRAPVEFDLPFLHLFSKCIEFDRLYNEWIKSGCQKEFKPTIDRINYKKPYLKSNIHWLSWSENRYKQTMERRCRKGKVAQMQGRKIISIHYSQRKAVIDTGIAQSNISSCLNGKRKTAGGYGWEYIYESPELIK